LKRIRGGGRRNQLIGFALSSWVYAAFHQFTGGFSLVARLLETRFWIVANGQKIFDASDAVFVSPKLLAVGLHQQK
jgi:hypothetical protein